tara:strand:- start:185 stop:454 length:270 start_codon:yes stop_codon:yes gene_type:complete
MSFFNKGKKKSFLQGSRRNPCNILIKEYTDNGVVVRKNRGFVLERNNKNQMYYVMTGNGGEERWYEYSEIELVKGHWTNRPRKKPEDEE